MAVYSYTGTLTDFGEAPFPSAVPRLWVEPERDAFTSSGLAAAKRIPIDLPASGVFDVDLVASVDLIPATRYTIRCEWLDDDTVIGWAQWDFTAQIGGGPISTMPGVLTRVWYSTEEPPANRAGIIWIHPATNDVRVWS